MQIQEQLSEPRTPIPALAFLGAGGTGVGGLLHRRLIVLVAVGNELCGHIIAAARKAVSLQRHAGMDSRMFFPYRFVWIAWECDVDIA